MTSPACLPHARAAIDEAAETGDRVLALRAELLAITALGQTDPTQTVARARGTLPSRSARSSSDGG